MQGEGKSADQAYCENCFPLGWRSRRFFQMVEIDSYQPHMCVFAVCNQGSIDAPARGMAACRAGEAGRGEQISFAFSLGVRHDRS